MLSPRQTFEDNIRPAELLLRLYRLLDCDNKIITEGEMVQALRALVKASSGEPLMMVYNEIFLGLIRERAQMPLGTLQRNTLAYLLRQSIVISCTALETYLPALLRTNLPIVIRAVGRDFIPFDDKTVTGYFKELSFSLSETLRLIPDPNAADYISSKILGLTGFKYLSGSKGVEVVGRLLGLNKPWDLILTHLGLDLQRKELIDILDRTVTRRNDIVHRADRSQDHPESEEQQEIAYAWTRQSVDAIQHVCLAVDELVAERIQAYKALIEANAGSG